MLSWRRMAAVARASGSMGSAFALFSLWGLLLGGEKEDEGGGFLELGAGVVP